MQCCLRRIGQHCVYDIPIEEKLSVNHRPTLAHIDQDNIADYFPVQSCSWAVVEHCTDTQFSCATLAQADQGYII